MIPKNRKDYRVRRHMRIRKRVHGTADRPRMALYVSSRKCYVQFIDDETATTLASASSSASERTCNVASAADVGRQAAEAAIARGISRVVVDRGGFLYHGKVRAIVEATVAAGISLRREEATDSRKETKAS